LSQTGDYFDKNENTMNTQSLFYPGDDHGLLYLLQPEYKWVEIFATNVVDAKVADKLIHKISSINSNYIVNFDLEDCDRILRIECKKMPVNVAMIVQLVETAGFKAAWLQD
jgi:hypothetical protein